MNEVLEKIMTFINENTIILIGICIFLILVLVGYLIDNSVKSKRVRKDIKNKDQVPENIKNEIIQEAIDEKNEENSIEIAEEEKNDLGPISFENNESSENMELNLDDVQNYDTKETELNLDTNFDEPLVLEDNKQPLTLDLDIQNDDDNGIIDSELSLDSTFNLDAPIESNLVLDSNSNDSLNIQSDEIALDPDAYTLEANTSEYKNDKKLSEILSDMNKTVVSENIFDAEKEEIVINPDVEKEKVEIETGNNSLDELDRIMQKLSSDNDDNYTNIF